MNGKNPNAAGRMMKNTKPLPVCVSVYGEPCDSCKAQAEKSATESGNTLPLSVICDCDYRGEEEEEKNILEPLVKHLFKKIDALKAIIKDQKEDNRCLQAKYSCLLEAYTNLK